MDTLIKAGEVYLRPRKAGKKWKPVWLSLFPPSRSGVGRLEIQDTAVGEPGTSGRRPHLHHGDRKIKVLRLSELISVLKLPPNAEACPSDNMSAFCVETEERAMVFAAPKDDCLDWVEKLCRSSFQRGGDSIPNSNQLHMEENQIYASADEVSDFWVVVQKTDAATRCDLQGAYWMRIEQESLVLREPQTKKVVWEWPYHLLRRYGNDKLTFTIEAGRRCDSGPGTFIFKTEQAENIFSSIQRNIKKKTSSNQSQDSGEKVVPNTQFVPQIQNLAIAGSGPESRPRTEVMKTASSVETPSSQPVPITLQPLPNVPTALHSSSPSSAHLIGQSQALYADPADFVPSRPQPDTATGVYVDPAAVLPLKPPGATRDRTQTEPASTDSPDSIYSEVFDKVSPLPSKVDLRRNLRDPPGHAKCFEESHYAYAEPLSEAEGKCPGPDEDEDPFAHLYAKVCKTKPSPSPSSSSNSAPTWTPKPPTAGTDDDVIYENLGVI